MSCPKTHRCCSKVTWVWSIRDQRSIPSYSSAKGVSLQCAKDCPAKKPSCGPEGESISYRSIDQSMIQANRRVMRMLRGASARTTRISIASLEFIDWLKKPITLLDAVDNCSSILSSDKYLFFIDAYRILDVLGCFSTILHYRNGCWTTTRKVAENVPPEWEGVYFGVMNKTYL